MCSKIFKIILGAFLLCSILASCSYFLGKKDANNSKNYYNLTFDEKASLSCVKNNSDLLHDYFKMERDDTQISKDMLAMKDCIHDAVDMFVKHTKGGEANSEYSAIEIHQFLSDSFEEYKYAENFMVEAFKLKESFIGGSAERINKQDINTLLVYVDYIYTKLAVHAHDRRVLFSDAKSEKITEERAQFLVASVEFQKTISEFKNLPRKSEGVFDYASLTRLITYFFDEGEDNHKWFDTFKIVNSLQSLMSSGQPDTIDIQKLPFVVDNLTTLFLSYIEFQKFLQNKEFYDGLSTVFTFPGLLNAVIKSPETFAGNNVEILNHIQINLLAPIKNSILAAPNGELKKSYVEALVWTFEDLKMLPSYTQGKTLVSMIPEFFGRWLTPNTCVEPCLAEVIKVETVNMLYDIINDWKERQIWVNQLTASQVGRDNVGNSRNRNSPAIRGRLASRNLQDFQYILSKMKYLHWEDYVVIGSNELNYKDAVIFNNIYTLVTIFTKPFNNNTVKASTSDYMLTQTQTQHLFEWFRDLGIELKIIDPRSLNSGSTAFIEINLFGSTSYNPDELNFSEMIEYLEISISTGLRSVYLMDNEFLTCRDSNGIKDVFDFTKLDAMCVRPIYKQNIERFLFSSLPHLSAYLKNSPLADLENMLHYLEKSSRQGVLSDAPMDTDTFRLSSSIAQYVENMFLRFDTNGDDIVDSAELQPLLAHIIPSIRMLIKAALDESTRNLLYSIFPDFERDVVTYMIKHKDLPDILKAENPAGQGFGALSLYISNLKDWVSLIPSWFQEDNKVTREDFLIVVSGLSYFQRTQRIRHIKDIFFDNDFRFDETISDPSDPVWTSLSNEIQCSTKIQPEVRQWLFDNQSRYWIKQKEDQASIFGIPLPFGSSSIPFNDKTTNWTDGVTEEFITEINADPKIGPLCGLPFLAAVEKQQVRPDQRPFVVEQCNSLLTFSLCKFKPGYKQPY